MTYAVRCSKVCDVHGCDVMGRAFRAGTVHEHAQRLRRAGGVSCQDKAHTLHFFHCNRFDSFGCYVMIGA